MYTNLVLSTIRLLAKDYRVFTGNNSQHHPEHFPRLFEKLSFSTTTFFQDFPWPWEPWLEFPHNNSMFYTNHSMRIKGPCPKMAAVNLSAQFWLVGTQIFLYLGYIRANYVDILRFGSKCSIHHKTWIIIHVKLILMLLVGHFRLLVGPCRSLSVISTSRMFGLDAPICVFMQEMY